MRSIGLICGVLAAVASAPALARPIPDGGVTAPEIAAIMQEGGLKALVTKDSDGDPMIESGVDGTPFRVIFYTCRGKPRCASIQFASGFDLKQGMTLARVNDWNRKNRFGRIYLDDEMDPILHMDVDFEHGATTEAVANVLDTWNAVLANAKKFINE